MSDQISPDLLEASVSPRRDWWAWLLLILAAVSIYLFVLLMGWLRAAGAQADRIVAAEHTGPVTIALFTADGQSLLTGTRDGELILTRVETAVAASRRKRNPEESPNTGRELRWGASQAAGDDARGEVIGAVIAPGGQALVTWDSAGSPTIWDLARGSVRTEATATLRENLAAAAQPETGEASVLSASSFEVASASFSADGAALALGSTDGRVAIVSAATGYLLRSWTVAEPSDFEPQKPAVSRHGRRGSDLSESVDDGNEVIPAPRATVHVAYLPEAFMLTTWIDGSGEYRAWMMPEGRSTSLIGGEISVAGAVVWGPLLPNKPRWAVVESVDRVRAHISAETVVFSGHTTAVTDVAWSGDGEWIASRAAAKDPIVVWNARTASVRGRFVTAGAIPPNSSIALSHDGSVLYAAAQGLTPTEAYLYVIETTAK